MHDRPVDSNDRPARCAHRFADANVWLVALCDVEDRWPDGTTALNGPAVHAAKTLRTYMSTTGYCYPSIAALGRRQRVEERAMQKAINALERAGWLIADRTGGRSNPSKYWTAIPWQGAGLVDRLADYLNTRSDRERTRSLLAEALATPSRAKGANSDALCSGHPLRSNEERAVAVTTHLPAAHPMQHAQGDDCIAAQPPGAAKGVPRDPKGVGRDGGSTTEDPSPLPSPSPSHRPAEAAFAEGKGLSKKPARRRAAAGTRVADALGPDFPRFREFLDRLAGRLDRADQIRGDEGSRLYQTFVELDQKAELALTVCGLIDQGWEPLLWQTLTDVPQHCTTAYAGCRNPAAAAARRILELELRLEEQEPQVVPTAAPWGAVNGLGSGQPRTSTSLNDPTRSTHGVASIPNLVT